MRVHILEIFLVNQHLRWKDLNNHFEINLPKIILDKTNSIADSTNKKDFIISIKYSS